MKALMEQKPVEANETNMLANLVQPDNYVGDTYWLNYENAHIQIHDSAREKVGGIACLSFLIASRLGPDLFQDPTKEDNAVILLRVLDSVELPHDLEAERIRIDAGRYAQTHSEGKNWDQILDKKTQNLLSYAGVLCRVLGTFFVDPKSKKLMFGTDVSNYYPNRCLRVFKPTGEALKQIVNYTNERNESAVKFGFVRYASSHRVGQGVDDVPVTINPHNLFAQKTAIFGMTRVGKSNTTKIIMSTIFGLRYTENQRIGQIIFDPNGEYANDNVQDGADVNPTCLKNIWKESKLGTELDIKTYGILPHKNDPKRIILKVNFFKDIAVGKDLVNIELRKVAGNIRYLLNFIDTDLTPPEFPTAGAKIRYDRLLLAYKSLLAKGGFTTTETPDCSKIFGKDFIDALLGTVKNDDASYDAETAKKYKDLANRITAAKIKTTWEGVYEIFKGIAEYAEDKNYNFRKFNAWYQDFASSSSQPWIDANLEKLLGAFAYTNGYKLIGPAKQFHTHTVTKDYVDEIYEDLVLGRLVIVDQSASGATVNDVVARRIIDKLFLKQQEKFRESELPSDILIYVEEAHNILPASKEDDLQDVWVRVAKEGAKYRLGLVYATQEVSSIQKNILKNTSNWFIAHLNNKEETRELNKFYDFADYEKSILRAQDKGFIRVKTISNCYVIPVQVDKFKITPAP